MDQGGGQLVVYLYSGTPGSGKSLHQAEDIYFWLKYGHDCIANFDIAVDRIPRCKGHFVFVDNLELTPDFLIRYANDYFRNHRFREGVLRVYIDECQLLFNAREWDMKGRKEWLSFFTQHRKYGYDVYLIAQFDRMIDRQIRSLIEYEVIHRKVSNFGIFGKIMSVLSMGKLFVAVKIWYPMREKVGSEFFKARKRYYQLYDSYKHFDVVDGGETASPAVVQDVQDAPVDQPQIAAPRLSKMYNFFARFLRYATYRTLYDAIRRGVRRLLDKLADSL